MDDFYPDVLGRLGKTPREFGAMQVHVEAVRRGRSGDALATVWLQAAFEPHDRGSLEVALRDGTVVAARLRLPNVGKGAVVKWSLPLAPVPEQVAELIFCVECPHPAGAERVRPPWKLFDTIEQPKLSEIDPKYAGEPMDGGSMLGIGLALGFGNVGRAFVRAVEATSSGTASGEGLVGAVQTKRHAAMELPRGVVAAIETGGAPAITIAQEEVVWAPGRDLPDAPPPLALKPVASAAPASRRNCSECGYLEERAGADGRFCPACGNRWD